MQVRSSGSQDTVGVALEVLGREGKGKACHRRPEPPAGTHPYCEGGGLPNPGWAECQACWSRPAPQVLVGP